jgi:hypothetical protein
MADEAVVFTPRYMLGVLYKMEPVLQWFLSTWCQDGAPLDTDLVDLDKVKGRRSVAPYVNPLDEATKLILQGYNTTTVKLPYMCEQVTISAKDLQIRQPGTTIYDSQGAYGRRAEIKAGEALKELEKRFTTTDEVSLATGLQTGVIPIVGPKINATVTLGMPAANLVTLESTDLWSDHTNADPIANIRAWKRLPPLAGGRVPSIACLGTYAADDLLKCAKLGTALDNRRIVRGEIQPKDLPDGIEYLGILEGVDLYVNHHKYVNASGVDAYFMDSTKILLGPAKGSSKCIRHFGVIYNLNCVAMERRFPLSWTTPDGKARIVQLETASLAIPYEIEDFVCATVTSEPE